MPENTHLKVESIFHPSDFSEASEVAFVHALKFALIARSQLSMLHVDSDSQSDWHDFPGVRETLVRWGLLSPESPRGAVADLGIEVRKVISESKDPVRSCLVFLEKHPADLIVLAVRPKDEKMSWLHKHVGEPIARHAGLMTLFIPHGIPGFVARSDGAVNLRNILIPITAKPRPQPAIEAIRRLVQHLQVPSGVVNLLHVGTAAETPVVKTPDAEGWQWNRLTKAGEPTPVILATAAETKADLIVMTTDGPDGFLDGLRGTTSERVLHKAPCPVLILPAGSMLG